MSGYMAAGQVWPQVSGASRLCGASRLLHPQTRHVHSVQPQPLGGAHTSLASGCASQSLPSPHVRERSARVAATDGRFGLPQEPQARDGSSSSSGSTDSSSPFSADAAASPAPASAAAAASATEAQPKDHSLEPFKALIKAQNRTFTCTLCGKCCTGDGEIWVSQAEAQRIAKHLNLSLSRFYSQYTKQYSRYTGWHMLKTKEGTSSCTFLRDDNKCGVHDVRPSQCSTYPWWPELMHDREWQWEKENVCEGFDHPEAPPLDLEAAALQLREANVMTAMRMAASTIRTSDSEAKWADQVILPDSKHGISPKSLNSKPWP